MNQIQEKQELPEFIKGIATKKSEITQRRGIVKKEYLRILDRLGKKNGKNKHFVHNDFLNVDVWIIKRESEKKASNVSAKKHYLRQRFLWVVLVRLSACCFLSIKQNI